MPKDKPHKRIQEKPKHSAEKIGNSMDRENEEKVGIETKTAKEIEKQTKKDERLEQETERDGDY